MRSLVLLLVVLLVTGCSTSVPAPVTSNYANIPSLNQVKLEPSQAQFPKARIVTENGIEYMAFTAEEGDQILAYRNASKNNREALTAMVGAHNEVVAERNILVQALKLEEAQKNSLARAYAEAENGRRQEQQTRIIETTIYKALLIIIGLSAL